MTRNFTTVHEAVAKRVAASRLKASEQVYSSFDQRPYNSPDIPPAQQIAAYGKVRTNPDYLNSLHDANAKKHFIPPGAVNKDGVPVVDKEAMLGLMADEAKYRLSTGEWTEARYEQAMAAMRPHMKGAANGTS